MERNIYLHAINATLGDTYPTIETYHILCKILKCRALLSSRLQRKFSTDGFNGRDYISLCDYDKKDIEKGEDGKYNAFHTYIRYSLSLVFPKDELSVIEPTILSDVYPVDKEGFMKMKKFGEIKGDRRFTDMPDEVQVKNKVPLTSMSALTYPTHLSIDEELGMGATIAKIMMDLESINKALDRFGYDVPIYDIDTFEKLDSSSSVRMLLKNK